jgi:DNA-binding PadR family transcriptional regulator
VIDSTDESPVPTLAFAILALLAREPLTGYQVSRQLRDPIGLFWQARHSQIYPVLNRLERLGWASAEEIPGPGPRPTRRFAIDDSGLAALRTWIAAPPSRRSGRDELLLRVYASWVADRSVTLGLLREAEARHRQQLATYDERRRTAEDRGVADDTRTADFADYATLRRGIGFERGRIAWLRWLIGRFEDGEPTNDAG